MRPIIARAVGDHRARSPLCTSNNPGAAFSLPWKGVASFFLMFVEALRLRWRFFSRRAFLVRIPSESLHCAVCLSPTRRQTQALLLVCGSLIMPHLTGLKAHWT